METVKPAFVTLTKGAMQAAVEIWVLEASAVTIVMMPIAEMVIVTWIHPKHCVHVQLNISCCIALV